MSVCREQQHGQRTLRGYRAPFEIDLNVTRIVKCTLEMNPLTERQGQTNLGSQPDILDQSQCHSIALPSRTGETRSIALLPRISPDRLSLRRQHALAAIGTIKSWCIRQGKRVVIICNNVIII